MAKKTIAQTDVSNKRILCRVDFNVPLDDAGAITDDRRIREALPTLSSVLSRGGSLILMSHLGRPEGKGFEPAYSLKPVARRLGELLGTGVLFPGADATDAPSAAAVNALKPGQVLLLENVRFAKGEKKGEPDYANKLAAYGHVYVNDAFGTAHRTDGSMYAVPKAMKAQEKPCVAGLLLEKELKYLDGALRNPARPFVVVLGGAKVGDKIGVIENLLGKADDILIGGAMAYPFLKALGKPVGSSRAADDDTQAARKVIDLAAKARCQLFLPRDHVVSTTFGQDGHRDLSDGAINDGYIGLDIGPRTLGQYTDIIRKARTIVWNGPMGVFEWDFASVGTRGVAKAMVEATRAGATSIVGGGDSAAAAEQFGLASGFSHVSTGGGASLEMLAGKPFATVDLLDNA
ncbi:MAG: phosphoglycerate kinase [Phycisphaerales bacterium]|nr:phosphoglycerate kinase [Phycisphaerales bacterium]